MTNPSDTGEVDLPVTEQGKRTDASQLAPPAQAATPAAKDSKVEQDEFLSVLTLRRRIGYGVFAAAGGGVLWLINHALDFATWLQKQPPNAVPSVPSLVVMGVVSLAATWIVYHLARVGERMMLPSWIIEQNPQAANAMLGIRDPGAAAVKMIEKGVDLAAKARPR